MLNPINWINSLMLYIGESIVLSSYHLCLIGGMIGLILYVFGLKKGKDYAFIAPAIYIIVKILGGVLLGI